MATTKYEKSVNHILLVQQYMLMVVINLQRRMLAHDASKLQEPERSAYDGLDEKLSGVAFGSSEYRAIVKNHLGDALRHHYAHNDHHIEHWGDGVKGMSLLSMLEMLADLRAVCDEKGKPVIDLDVNQKIHGFSDELFQILSNTIDELGWGVK